MLFLAMFSGAALLLLGIIIGASVMAMAYAAQQEDED